MSVIDDVIAESEVDLGEDIGEQAFNSILYQNMEVAVPRMAVQRGGGYIARIYLVRSLDYRADFTLLMERRNGKHTYHVIRTSDPVKDFETMDAAFQKARYEDKNPDLFAYRHRPIDHAA